MAGEWSTVRVFISPTFRDMHSERDYLVKVVFPALRERLEPHRVHLVDIDLRWGITEEQAENDEVLDLCLDQIDECRPFFLGLLGERYGWVPESLPKSDKKHGWTQHHTGKSVTELEILWGVLLKEEMYDQALFFFRDPQFLSDIPHADLLHTCAEFPNKEDRERLSECRLTPRQVRARVVRRREDLRRLKQETRTAGLPIPIVDNYPCRYAGLGINWGIAKFDLTDAEVEALEDVAEDGLVDNEEYATLDEHLRGIVHHYRTVALEGLEEFGQAVLDRLWTAIRKELKLDEAGGEFEQADPLTIERGFHERFMESRLRVSIGRQSLQDQLMAFATGDGEEPALVTGPSGSGKSAALAKFVTTYLREHPETLVIPHFVGASPGSTSLRQTLHRFCSVLKEEFGFDDDVPPDTNSLINTFRQFVTQVPDDRRVLLVFDALNQLDESENAQHLYWLPWQFPPHVRVITSCINDPGREEAVLKAFEHREPDRMEVPPLTDAERFEIVKEVPSLSAKALNPQQVQLLLENLATANPLYLLVALEELRGFGSFEQLNRRISAFPSGEDAVTELFVQVIHRLQDEFDELTVYEVLSLLASARRGLSDRELLDVVEGRSVSTAESQSDLFPVLRQLRPYLQHRGELWDFFHRNLYKAVD